MALQPQTFDDLFTHSRLGNATMTDSDGLLKWGPHNLALNSATPATQSITVVSGADYTVECTGSGSITLSGAGTGTVTEGNPVEVTASTTSLTLTVAGDVDLMWCYRSDLGGMAPVPVDARVAGSTTYVPTTSTAKYLPRRHNHRYDSSVAKWNLHNLWPYSEDATQWGTGPISGMTVSNGQITVSSDQAYGYIRPAAFVAPLVQVSVEFDVTSDTTVANVPFRVTDTSAGDVDTALVDLVAGETQRVSFTLTPTVTTIDFGIDTRNAQVPGGSNETGYTVTFDKVSLYRSDLNGMEATGSPFPTYLATTGTAVEPTLSDVSFADNGTLIETEARTNIITHSEDLSDASFNKSATLSIGTPVARKGVQLDEVISTTGEAYRVISSTDSALVANGDFVAFSFYVENVDATNSAFRIADVPGGATTKRVTSYLEWSGGVPTLSGPTTSGLTHFDSHVEDLGDGLYRVSMVVQNATGGALTLYGVAYHSWNLDEATSLYMGGFQLEAASTLSSYIPTSGSSVTRAADTSGLTIPSSVSPWPTPRVIGDELVTNGTFDSDLSGWTLGSDPAQVIATFDAGRVSLTRGAGGSSGFSQNIGMTAGKVYRVTFDVISGVAAVGTGFPATGGLSGSVELVKVATNSSISLWPSSTSSTTVIDNISVKEIDPLVVAIQMKGRATGDSYTTLRWYADANNYITQEIGTSDFTFEQAASGTVDSVTGGSITSGVNVPFSIASYHGSTFVNGAVDGTALTADTTPVALPDLSGTDLQIGYDFMGNVEQVRIWVGGITDVTSGNLLISEASS